MKTILVTGASGLIGSHLIRQLLNDHQVIGVSRRKPTIPADLSSRYTHHAIDFSSDFSFDRVGKPDAIIHLALSERFKDFPDGIEEIFRVNALSTASLLKFAKDNAVKKFVYASTGGVYGQGSGLEESSPLAIGKLNFYQYTKLCSELITDSFQAFMDVQVLRFFYVYGPGQAKERLIPKIVESVKNGTPIEIEGQNGIRVNPIYVTDATEAVIKCLSLQGSHRINIAGPDTLSLRRIAEMAGRLLGKEPTFKNNNRPGEDLVGSTEKMEELLGIKMTPFESGLRKYLESL